jgi:hypothetical protein
MNILLQLLFIIAAFSLPFGSITMPANAADAEKSVPESDIADTLVKSVTGSDASTLLQLEKTALSLDQDVIESSKIAIQKRNFDEFQCANETLHTIDDITEEITSAYDLVMLSTKMKDIGDKVAVAIVIETNTLIALKRIEQARKYALHQSAWCSNSAAVNAYVQKTTALADHAATAFNNIEDKVAWVN